MIIVFPFRLLVSKIFIGIPDSNSNSDGVDDVDDDIDGKNTRSSLYNNDRFHYQKKLPFNTNYK